MVGTVLCTVSTVKDTRANVEQFVERNLRSGADHMFVFLEGDEDGTLAFLRENPHVTAVRTDDAYWAGERPRRIIDRQMTNANLVNWVVSCIPSVEWLVHLDGDECLEIDKKVLAKLGADVRAVRLAVIEAVSTEQPTREELFKKKLSQPDLEKLTELGVIDAPHNRHYLRGHLIGKAAVRPGLEIEMGIHRASLRGGTELEHLKAPGFRVLHYDSVSPEDFVRQWTLRLAAEPNYRPERSRVGDAVATVLADHDADEAERADRLRAVFREYVADPVDVLLEHDLLVRPRPRRHSHRPAGLAHDDRRAMEQLFVMLLGVGKEHLQPRRPAGESIEVMRRLRRSTPLWHRSLRTRIDDAIRRARDVLPADAVPG